MPFRLGIKCLRSKNDNLVKERRAGGIRTRDPLVPNQMR